MAVPRAVKATTQAIATNAAATAYSESSSPVSSWRKFVIIFCSLFLVSGFWKGLTTRFTRVSPQLKRVEPIFCRIELSRDGGGQGVDLRANGGAESCESGNDGDRNQSCGNGIFRQLKTCFIAKEIPNHFFWLL